MSLLTTFKQEVNSSGYTAINLPAGTNKIRNFAISPEDGSTFYISGTGSDADRFTAYGGFPVSMDFKQTMTYGSGTVTLCYVKGTSTTDIGVVIL